MTTPVTELIAELIRESDLVKADKFILGDLLRREHGCLLG